jgi:hypothetical protein
MVDPQLFKKLCAQSRLGEIVGVPVSISGGLLHKIYAIETDKGKYAIKLLNPRIMLRPDAMNKYNNSERIANLVSKKVPAAPAKRGLFFKKKKVDKINLTKESSGQVTSYQCCFCDKGIQSNEVTSLIVVSNWENARETQHEQQMFCHMDCLRKSVSRNFPLYIADIED